MIINPLDLTGRVIVVTGGSSGIGLATAVLLSQLGARLVLVARTRERLIAAERQLDGCGHRIAPVDLALADEVPLWLKTLSREGGAISGVVHCAGTQILRPLRALASTELDALLKVNVHAAVMLAKGFRQAGVHAATGSLVLISSVMGLVGAPGRAAYCASKSALQALTRALAVELAPEGLRVNCVAPGFVRTPMLEQAEATLGPEQIRRVEALHPLGFGSPRDVAYAIAFLLADTSRWITGTTLVVDGGYTAQ